jgi:hypothetical protein
METVEKIRELTQHKRAAKKIARNKARSPHSPQRSGRPAAGRVADAGRGAQAEIRNLLDSVKARPRFAKMVECACAEAHGARCGCAGPSAATCPRDTRCAVSVECLKNLAVDDVTVEEIIDEGALQVSTSAVTPARATRARCARNAPG